MRVHPFENRAMAHIIQHLHLRVEVLQTRRRAELGRHLRHERRHIAVPGLMPVVIGPVIADRPLVGLRYPGAERLECRERWRAGLNREAVVQRREIKRWVLIFIWTTVLQVYLVRTRRIITSAIER